MKRYTLILVSYALYALIYAQPGTVDYSFNEGYGMSYDGGSDHSVNSILVLPDGKILAGGEFQKYNDYWHENICRIEPDGNIDATFFSGFSSGQHWVNSMALQADGKILVGGRFWYYEQQQRRGLLRLNSDGSLDQGFNLGNQDNRINCVLVQPDGKILIAGFSVMVDGLSSYQIARVNADGSSDPTFTGGFVDSNVDNEPSIRAFVLQPDGKIILGGNFSSYNGTTRNGIVRLNPDGSPDPTFITGTGIGGVNRPLVQSIALQPNGKILIGGDFTSYNGNSSKYLARLNPNGTKDNTFTPATIEEFLGLRTVGVITLQSNGQILIGGSFYIPGEKSFLARLNANGSLDNYFDPSSSSGLNGEVYAIALQPDGKILIGGDFMNCGSSSRENIARLFGTPTSGIVTFDPSENISLFPNPATENLILTGIKSGTFVKLINASGQIIHEQKVVTAQVNIPVSAFPSGMYTLQIMNENHVITKKVVINTF